MEYGKAVNYRRDEKVQERIKFAIEYLRTAQDLAEKAVGNYQIAEGVEIRMQSYETRDVDSMRYESHYKFLDIHYMISGQEYIRICPLSDLKPVSEYDEKEDIIFYENPASYSKLILAEKDYMILDPQDVHMAHGTIGETPLAVKKIVVKIALN